MIISEETRKKMSLAKLGKPSGRKGIKFTTEWKKNLSKAHLGQKAWNKGKKILEMSGENHFAWKGERVSYRALHTWIERVIGKPTKCEFCDKNGLRGHQIHWANKSHQYKRELSDWLRLCSKCHGAYDRNQRKLQSIYQI